MNPSDKKLGALRLVMEAQFRANATTNLFTFQAEDAVLSKETVAFAMREKDGAAGMLPPLFGDESESRKRLAAWMADRLMRHVMRINQFAAMTADEKEQLLRIYEDYLDTIGETILAAKDREGLALSLRSLVVRHFFTLRSFFQGIRDAKLFDSLRHSPVLLHIPCFEYTPELQIELLGI
ncbi:hypothetical protein QJ48_20390, partial [Paenibacillus sp. A3]|uniref:hypothetical protein n=1 Tax=Paenibacillus sp. A3 TaxID=1337054 RepID=UPI0006E57B7D